jgi:type I restriction enzyme, S subunit
MASWKSVPLGQLTKKIGSGATPTGGSGAYKDAGVSLIRSQNVLDLGFSMDGLAYIDDTQAMALNNVTVEEKDVLLNITGDSVARSCMVPANILPARVNQHVAILRANPTVLDSHFLLYYLQHAKEELLIQSEIGATRKALTKGILDQLAISLPSIKEQQIIAEVLSSLDDKIDLLHRQNRTLEHFAEVIFRHWFSKGDFGGTRLGNVVRIAYGKNLPTKNLADDGYPVYGANGFIGYYEQYTYDEPQVLVSCRGEASGVVNFSPAFSFVTNNSLILEIPTASVISFEFLKYYALATDFKLYVTGSAQPQITIENLRDAEIRIPQPEQLHAFTIQAKAIEEKRSKNAGQIASLEKARNTLLPKLMSGEVGLTK